MERREDSSKIAQLEAQIRELRTTNAHLRAQVDEYKNKEQTISSAIIASIDHANQLEASRKKLYSLDIQRSRLMYLRMEQIINELLRGIQLWLNVCPCFRNNIDRNRNVLLQ